MTTPVVTLKVDKDPRDPNFGVPHEERVGECLQFAAEYVMDQGGLLCHGSIFREGVSDQRIGHAFVITQDGGAFEPTLGLWFPMWEAYFTWAQVQVDVVYSQEEAALHMLRTGHYGTWHEDHSGVWGDGS